LQRSFAPRRPTFADLDFCVVDMHQHLAQIAHVVNVHHRWCAVITAGSTSSFVGTIDILHRTAGGALKRQGTRFEPAGLAPSRRGRMPQKARCGNQDRSHPRQWRAL
jgi:hypothetical protein